MSVKGSGTIFEQRSVEKTVQEIEKSLITTFRKPIWSKFTKAIREFEMIQTGDKIAVAISGGKDSLMMAKLFQELHRHGRQNFELVFLAMDPGYHESVRQMVKENCEYLGIPVQIVKSDIFDVVDKIGDNSPCYMCARMRRGVLYRMAEELGCNKLALGHHFTDVIETTMMNVLFSGNFKTMLPKLQAENFEGMTLIRPMYYIHEDRIKSFSAVNGIIMMNCGCAIAEKGDSGMRAATKVLIRELKEKYPNVEKSIFQSARNVNVDAILDWKQDGEKFSFMDQYKK